MRTWAIAPVSSLWADGYSGCGGVARKESQFGSGVIRNPSALRMALIGRQKLYVYLESQQAIAASAAAMFRRANIRALSEMDSFLAAATWLAIGFQMIVAEEPHHIATSVSGPIRTTLFWAPMFFTSLTSITCTLLSSAGGGPRRNCDWLLITQGVTRPQPGSEAGANAGGVGTQTPALPEPGAV